MIVSFVKSITTGPNGSVLTVHAQAPQANTEIPSAVELGTFDGVTYLYVPEDVGYTLEAQVPYQQVADLDAFIEAHPEFASYVNEKEEALALEAFRAQRVAEVEAIATRFDKELKVEEMYFTSSLGFPCDSDRKSTQNIEGLLTGFDLVASMSGTDTIKFKDRNNEYHDLTKAQVETLAAEIGANGSYLYSQKWAQLIFLATATKEQLKNFTATYQMANFNV